MSAKVTVRELDGTEYQLKKRVGQLIVKAGYARDAHRGLIVMLSISLPHALKIVTDNHTEAGIGPDGCALAVYPCPDSRSNPQPFGMHQDWASFPVTL